MKCDLYFLGTGEDGGTPTYDYYCNTHDTTIYVPLDFVATRPKTCKPWTEKAIDDDRERLVGCRYD